MGSLKKCELLNQGSTASITITMIVINFNMITNDNNDNNKLWWKGIKKKSIKEEITKKSCLLKFFFYFWRTFNTFSATSTFIIIKVLKLIYITGYS